MKTFKAKFEEMITKLWNHEIDESTFGIAVGGKMAYCVSREDGYYFPTIRLFKRSARENDKLDEVMSTTFHTENLYNYIVKRHRVNRMSFVDETGAEYTWEYTA